MSIPHNIVIKRVYEPLEKNDGFRVLVDRLWPRGLTKEAAHIDLWLKDVAPSPILRKWFNHSPERWKEFSKEYVKELKHSAAIGSLSAVLKEHKKVTLLYGAKDSSHTHALVLLQFINQLPG